MCTFQFFDYNYGEYLEQLRAGDNIFFKSMIDVNECFEIFFKDLYFDNVFHKFLIENKIDSETVKKQKVDNLLDGITKMIDYLWEFTSIFEISYTLENDRKNFSKILKEDNLFSYFIIDYHCYINLKNIYDLIMNDYVSFVDQTKYEFDYFYSNKKDETKKIDAVPKTIVEKTSKKSKTQKTIFEFIYNISNKEEFLNELKKTFTTEKGQRIKAIIDYLVTKDIIIIQDGDYNNFVTVLKEYFNRNIGKYQGIQNIKHIHKSIKEQIEKILQPLVDKYKTTQ